MIKKEIDVLLLLIHFGFSVDDSSKYYEAILKKDTDVLNELQSRLVIKFGVDNGEDMYKELTKDCNYTDIHESLYTKGTIDDCLELME